MIFFWQIIHIHVVTICHYEIIDIILCSLSIYIKVLNTVCLVHSGLKYNG